MPEYVAKALHKFGHICSTLQTDAPYEWTEPAYDAKVQYAPEEDIATLLDAKGKTPVQQIIGTFLYYARIMDHTQLAALNSLGEQQGKPTEKTKNVHIERFLNYCASHPTAIIRYHASDDTMDPLRRSLPCCVQSTRDPRQHNIDQT